jgi:hypothetical protein
MASIGGMIPIIILFAARCHAAGDTVCIGFSLDRPDDIRVRILAPDGAVVRESATTKEMGRNIGEAATGSSGIAERITAVAQAMGDAARMAGDTRSSAGELAQMADRLR